MLSLLGRYAEAASRQEPNIRRTQNGMRATVGLDHPWTLGVGLNAARARSLTGDEEGAGQLSPDMRKSGRRVLSETHPLTLSRKAALTADLRSLQCSEKAAKPEAEALRLLADTPGEHHPHTLSVWKRKLPYWGFEPLPTRAERARAGGQIVAQNFSPQVYGNRIRGNAADAQ